MIRQELPLRYGYGIACTRFVVTFSDLAALTASLGPQSITLADAGGTAFQVAQGGLVLGIRMKVDTQFAAPALAALTMKVGKAGGTAGFFDNTPFNLMAAVADNSVRETLDFLAGQDAAFSVNVTFTGDAANNLNTVTAGQVHIDVFTIQFGPINTQANVTSVTP